MCYIIIFFGRRNMKIKVHLSEFRRYTEKATEVFQQKKLKGLQEYCVGAGLNLSAIYTIILESIEDEELLKKRDMLVTYYDYIIEE